MYDRIREAIRQSPLFQLDFFFQSRNAGEISRRCNTLLGCILKEISPEQSSMPATNGKRSKDSTLKLKQKAKQT